jgi:hypothetical protein
LKTNRDYSKELQTKDDLKKKLNIKFEYEDALGKDKLNEYSQESKQKLQIQRSLHRGILGLREKKSKPTRKMKIEVPNAFRLQEMFEKWYEEGERSTTFLMKSLDKKFGDRFHASQFFHDWEVQYEGTVIFKV